jgi:hypothetical protein
MFVLASCSLQFLKHDIEKIRAINAPVLPESGEE